MKLKKAMREYASAVDDLAFATNAIILADMDLCSPEVFGALVHWRDEARREKKRAVRQMHAVMSAMQYRGKDKMWTPPQKREITRLRVPGDIVNAAARAVLMGCTSEALLRYKGRVRLGGFTSDEAISRRVKMFQHEDANGIRSRHKYINAYD